MEELHEIVADTSFNGRFTKFYEELQLALEQYTDKRIEGMRSTLVFVSPDKTDEIAKYDKMRVLYEYSLLI